MGTSSIPERPPVMSRAPATREYAEDDDRGYGWVMFAGVLLMILGTLNFIMGIAAIGNAHFFTANAHYVAGSLNTWGWVVLCIGALEWARRSRRVLQEPVRAVDRRARSRRELTRAADDDAGISVLVAVDLRARHPRDLRIDRVRQANHHRLTITTG